MSNIIIAIIIVAGLALGGCMGIPEQKLADGEIGCQTVSFVYGSVSNARSRTDNPGKGGGTGKQLFGTK